MFYKKVLSPGRINEDIVIKKSLEDISAPINLTEKKQTIIKKVVKQFDENIEKNKEIIYIKTIAPNDLKDLFMRQDLCMRKGRTDDIPKIQRKIFSDRKSVV